jgi:hypothetical protein
MRTLVAPVRGEVGLHSQSQWWVYGSRHSVAVAWGLMTSVLTYSHPSVTWCRIAPDVRQAAPQGTPLSLVLGGVSGVGSRTVAAPVRRSRRTLTRGPMVRKKASRLQVEQVRNRTWLSFCSVPPQRRNPAGAWAGYPTLRALQHCLEALQVTPFCGVAARAPARLRLQLAVPAGV